MCQIREDNDKQDNFSALKSFNLEYAKEKLMMLTNYMFLVMDKTMKEIKPKNEIA